MGRGPRFPEGLYQNGQHRAAMHKGPALLALAAFLAVGLAGCSSGGDSGGFSIKAPGEPGGKYVFKASGSADNYTWDMGDHLTILYGKEVRHAYDFQNGI